MATKQGRLTALAFDDPYKAEEARAALHRMAGEGLAQIHETAIIVKTADGKVRTSQDVNEVQKDQHTGHIIGLVAAAVTGTFPLIMAGTLAGRLVGRLTDDGITNKFIKALKDEVKPGTSALIIFGRSDPARRKEIIERLQVFSPKLLESEFPPQLEDELNKELQSAGKGASGG